jgi:16S rRNA (guanine1207-N2)-methyltransferase
MTMEPADSGHYFDRSPAAASDPRVVTLALPDLTVDLRTDRGVFSAGRVDPGTRLLLLEAPPPPPAGELLDLGCGYGPVAVTLARRAPGARVWAVDVNERALALAAANAVAAGAGNVVAAAPAGVPAGLRFAAVYSNPPIRIGKAALHDLLGAWVPRSDVAYLVVGKHLGSDSLARWMAAERGWRVERLAGRAGYRLLEVRA